MSAAVLTGGPYTAEAATAAGHELVPFDITRVDDVAPRHMGDCTCGRWFSADYDCQAGLNRSALVAGLALVLSGMPAKGAVAKLRERRSPAVLCNPTFEAWLLAQDKGPLL